MLNTLRDFYYLDEKTLNNYVSTIEDGIEQEKQISISNEKPKWNFEISTGELQKVLASIGIPIPDVAIGRNGKSQSISINKTAQPTPQSLYNRLETYLEPAIQYLNGFDKEIWNQIEEGLIVKFKSEIELPSILEYGNMFVQIGNFINLAKDFDIPLEGIDHRQLQGAYKYGQKVTEKRTQKVKLKPSGSPNPQKMYFVGNLNSKYLEMDLQDLSENEFTVLGRIEKVLKSGEKYTIFDPTLSGLTKSLNRKAIRDLQKENKKSDIPFEVDLFAVKPAIVLNVIAIYK